MKEIAFISRNKKKWEDFEHLIHHKVSVSPDELADYYIELTDDLSYARTFYSGSSIVGYLNSLTAVVHNLIYRNKKEKGSRLFGFWITELPLSVYNSRRDFLISFLIFVVSFAIGFASVYSNEDFLRVVLGDSYVNTTLDNIAKGDPFGVYGTSESLPMAVFIAANNIRVSVMAFVIGVFTPIAVSLILAYNGIMTGAFLGFFMQRSMGAMAALTIMLHGTMELSAIVLAGGAGILLGKSILFVGTYPRKFVFMRGVRQGTKIILGLMPFFIVAAIIEGFFTRYYLEVPPFLSGGVIFVSLLLMIWYFVIYPRKIYLQNLNITQNGNIRKTSRRT
jgi:uncharacterized membrane protein SpoIIM required for sporulation